MEGKKMTFGRGLRWVLCFLLIGAVIGGSFGVGYTLSRQPQDTNTEGGASYMLRDNGYTGNSDQTLLANPLVGENVKNITENVKDSVVVIITRAQEEYSDLWTELCTGVFCVGSGVIFRRRMIGCTF